MQIQWSDRFTTGNSLVDHQHQALFEAVNAFDEAQEAHMTPARIDGMLAFLARYVAEHFATEEFLMVRCGFPGLPEHRAQHENLTSRVRYIRDLRAQDPALVPADGLSKFLGDWLMNHILHWDAQVFDYLREHPVEPD